MAGKAYLQDILIRGKDEVAACNLESDVGHGGQLGAVNDGLAVAKEGQGLADPI